MTPEHQTHRSAENDHAEIPREPARFLLSQARAELAAGDVRQASEKGWGAAAQIVKAVAHSRGWQHRGHILMFDVVDDLRVETGDADIQRLFRRG